MVLCRARVQRVTVTAMCRINVISYTVARFIARKSYCMCNIFPESALLYLLCCADASDYEQKGIQVTGI